MDFSNPTTHAMIGGIIRAALVAIGTGGVMSSNQIGVVAGAIAALFGVAWSIYQKHAQASTSHQTLTNAVQAAAPTPEIANSVIADAKAGKF